MRLPRMILAVLALVALILGAPLRGAMAHCVLPPAKPMVHSPDHAHAESKPCQHCPKSHDALCDMACAGAVAIVEVAARTAPIPVAYSVQFPGAPGLILPGVVLPPDPFPPKTATLL